MGKNLKGNDNTLELNGSKILVTGGSGFLGKVLINKLNALNYAVKTVAPTADEYDLRIAENIERLLEDHKPNVIIHLAAVVGGIGANRSNAGRFFYDNAIMGIQLIELARKAGVEKFVGIGSICAYPKFAQIPFNEDELWNGYPEETNAPYGLAKKMMLVQLQAYRQQYDFNGIYLLPVNLYGPGDNFDLESSHVIPAIIIKMVEAKKKKIDRLKLWGDGSPTREFLYVEDAADGIIKATMHYKKDMPVNLGSGREISIRDLAGLIRDKVGYDGKIVWDESYPNGQPRRCLNVERAEREFGFRAETTLEEGLDRTIEWFMENRDNIREIKF